MLYKDALFAVRNGVAINRGRLWADVRACAQGLPNQPYLFNLCEDRYLFCVTLLAAMLRRQICLLPSSSNTNILRDLLRDFPACYQVSEKPPTHSLCPWFPVERTATPKLADAEAIAFDPEQIAVIAFTSGSTGYPKACPKTWGSLQAAARLAVRSLGLEHARLVVISTTPPQHMYGLETSIFWPLFSSLLLHAGWPFFPEDVRRHVRNAPLPCLLVSTPLHLRTLCATSAQWPNLHAILCSTANLSQSLAIQIEQSMGVLLSEIYGSTETLSFAFRETARESIWRPYLGVSLETDYGTDATGFRLDENLTIDTSIEHSGYVILIAPHLADPIRLQDLIHLETCGGFSVLGRSTDMVKIAGKRISLAELERRLTDIDGVADGVCLIVADVQRESRVMAVVVSELNKHDIINALSSCLDPVFLPKRIVFVGQIPRNAVGKVVREELDKLLTAGM